MNLILASSSVRRLSLLKQIGVIPELVISPDIDETPIHKEKPSALVTRLAFKKAFTVSRSYPSHIVLSADTVVTKGTRILGKPKNQDEEIKFLTLLSGSRHRVYTGMCAIKGDRVIKRSSFTIVKFKNLTPYEINTYINRNEWQDKSGGYSIQGFANAFIEKIIGSDTTVVGLNLNIAYKVLTNLGLKI